MSPLGFKTRMGSALFTCNVHFLRSICAGFWTGLAVALLAGWSTLCSSDFLLYQLRIRGGGGKGLQLVLKKMATISSPLYFMFPDHPASDAVYIGFGWAQTMAQGRQCLEQALGH